MNHPSQTTLILPCHSYEDFPTHHRGRDAENLLACWTAVWHPALIAITGQAPSWQSVDDQIADLPERCLIIPAITNSRISDCERNRLQVNHQVVIVDQGTRAVILDSIFRSVGAADDFRKNLDSEVVSDFFALGYAYLQIQIMTRQLRYSSNLDEDSFSGHLVAAARAAVENAHNASAELTVCFDLLLEERNAYYPVKANLIDLVLTAFTTLGPSLERQFNTERPLNLHFTGHHLEAIHQSNPHLLDRIRFLAEQGIVSVVGGWEAERPEPLLSIETTIRLLESGQTKFQKFLEFTPKIFFRWRSGLTPSLPELLEEFGYQGAIHATLDGGKIPSGSHAVMRWSGNDQAAILAIGIPPMDADDAGSLLRLGLEIGEQIDSMHEATIVFAHWPDRTCESYSDLLRTTKFGSIFGDFIRLEEYFETAHDPGFDDSFTPDDYRLPFFQQAIDGQQPDPISRYVDYWRASHHLAALRAMFAMRVSMDRQGNTPIRLNSIQEIETLLQRLESQLDERIDESNAEPFSVLAQELEQLSQLLAVRGIGDTAIDQGLRLFNPTNSVRRSHCETESRSISVKSEEAIVFADSGQNHTDWVTQTPGLGLGTLTRSNPIGRDPLRSDPPVLAGNLLRNEFFEIQIDENTGGIRSLQCHGSRDNLLSQQLAMRIPATVEQDKKTAADETRSPLKGSRYSTMKIDSLSSEQSSRIRASITSRGRILDQEQVMAHFTQTVRVTRGLPVAEVEIQIDPHVELTNSINHYFCNRIAWKDESAAVISNDQENKQTIMSDWFQGTQYIQVDDSVHNVTMLTGGLPWHRRVSRRMIDTVLIAGNESRRDFHLGLAVDVRYPLMTARQWASPMFDISTDNEPDSDRGFSPQSGWLYHFNCRNILATWWKPVFDSKRLTGMMVRLKETEGRPGTLTLRCPLAIESAARVGLQGDFVRTIELVADDGMQIDFNAWELFQVKIVFG